jgi:hypothetical protein
MSSANGYTPITLDDLSVKPVVITVKTEYGRESRIRVVTLTCAQWAEIGTEVATPPEPAQKTPATQQVWEKHKARAEEERMYRRIVFGVEGGGNPIPGSTPSEKVENWRRTVDQGISNSIGYFLAQAAMGSKASVEADADRFHAGNGSDPAEL